MHARTGTRTGRGLGTFWFCLFLFYSTKYQSQGLAQVEGMDSLTELLLRPLWGLQNGNEFGKIQMSMGCKIPPGRRWFSYILLSKWALASFLDLNCLLVSNQLELAQGAEWWGAATPFPKARLAWGCSYWSDFRSSSLLPPTVSLPTLHGLSFKICNLGMYNWVNHNL